MIISNTIPDNAKYTSPDIQIEVIDIFTLMVKDSLQNTISQSSVISILADTTRDKQNIEDLAIAIRFINNEGTVSEGCVSIVKLESANAESISNSIITELQKFSIDFNKITSLGFDGAAVMSGDISGVHTRLNDYFGKNVPFEHCFNHLLHLAVMQIVGAHRFA